jgi:hypothetical protein
LCNLIRLGFCTNLFEGNFLELAGKVLHLGPGTCNLGPGRKKVLEGRTVPNIYEEIIKNGYKKSEKANKGHLWEYFYEILVKLVSIALPRPKVFSNYMPFLVELGIQKKIKFCYLVKDK